MSDLIVFHYNKKAFLLFPKALKTLCSIIDDGEPPLPIRPRRE